MWRLIGRALADGPSSLTPPSPSSDALAELGGRVGEAARARLGRSLALRAVDAGSCNGCELELRALLSPVYDLERFGIRFAASPRHADVLLVTGPVTSNMVEAIRRTYEAMPSPKWAVAIGDCGLNGGCFRGGTGVVGGVGVAVPVDLHIPGCPPNPMQLLSGLLALLQSVEKPLP